MKYKGLCLFALMGVLGCTSTSDAKDATSIKSREAVGTLLCEIQPGVGLILGSSRSAACSFRHSNGKIERYSGLISRIGLDLGVVTKSTMYWAVLPTGPNKSGSYALEGEYIGVSGGASLGVGFGANVLIGGSDKSIALQPISIEGAQGLNVALGVGKLKLQRIENLKSENTKKLKAYK